MRGPNLFKYFLAPIEGAWINIPNTNPIETNHALPHFSFNLNLGSEGYRDESKFA